MIRLVNEGDLRQLLELYLFLHETSIPDLNQINQVWNKILSDDNYNLIVCEIDGKLVASCTCIVVPNLTRGGSSYALIENVVTHEAYRNRGYASACLNFAKQLAIDADCYKMMLITGSKDENTHRFYQNAGYYSEGKTAYYQLLKEVNWSKL